MLVTPQIPGPIRIDPSAIYTTHAIVLALDVPSGTIRRAIRRRELPAVRRGNQTYVTGRDLLAWLSPPTATAQREETHVNG